LFTCASLLPELRRAIETSVLQRFSDVFRAYPLSPRKIRQGSGDSEDPMVDAGAKLPAIHGNGDQRFGRTLQCADGASELCRNLGIAEDARELEKAAPLSISGGIDSPTNHDRGLPGNIAYQGFEPQLRHLDVDIEAVQQGLRQARLVAFDLLQ
jgi:hypothetical protein